MTPLQMLPSFFPFYSTHTFSSLWVYLLDPHQGYIYKHTVWVTDVKSHCILFVCRWPVVWVLHPQCSLSAMSLHLWGLRCLRCPGTGHCRLPGEANVFFLHSIIIDTVIEVALLYCASEEKKIRCRDLESCVLSFVYIILLEGTFFL